MPVLTLHLLRLTGASPESFLDLLLTAVPHVGVIVASKPLYLVIRPTKQDVSSLADTEYDLMLLIRTSDEAIPVSLRSYIQKEYKVVVGVPSRILATYPEKNRKLLEDAPSAGLTGSLDNATTQDSSQNLELSPELLRFMKQSKPRPMTMLNLLQFKSNGKPSYYKYGQKFVEVAGKRGGYAKIVGNVVKPTSCAAGPDTVLGDERKWQEIAIVHYPSMEHFCDMLSAKDYKGINEEFRLPALSDTLLLCTAEMDISAFGQRAKL